jgi:hypothetical protein
LIKVARYWRYQSVTAIRKPPLRGFFTIGEIAASGLIDDVTR